MDPIFMSAMKKFLPLILLAGVSSPALADVTHRMQSSIQLQTNAAATQVSRIGSTYSVSWIWSINRRRWRGSADLNVGGLGTLTDGVGQGSIATATHTAGTAFSFSQSFIEGDAIQTTAPSLGAVSAYSEQTSTGVGSGNWNRNRYISTYSNWSWWWKWNHNNWSVRN